MSWWGSLRARAWRCDRCTCLTVRTDRESDARCCDRCGGPLLSIPLRRKEA